MSHKAAKVQLKPTGLQIRMQLGGSRKEDRVPQCWHHYINCKKLMNYYLIVAVIHDLMSAIFFIFTECPFKCFSSTLLFKSAALYFKSRASQTAHFNCVFSACLWNDFVVVVVVSETTFNLWPWPSQLTPCFHIESDVIPIFTHCESRQVRDKTWIYE